MAEEKKPNETTVVQPPKEPVKEPPKVIEFSAEKTKAAPVDKVSQSKGEPAKDSPAKNEPVKRNPEKPKPEKNRKRQRKSPSLWIRQRWSI